MITGGWVLGEVITLFQNEVGIGIFLLLLAGVFLFCKKIGKSWVYLLLPVFFILGFCRMELENRETDRVLSWNLDGSYGEARGRILQISRKERSMGYLVEDVRVRVKKEEKVLKRLMIYGDLPEQGKGEGMLSPGDVILVTGRFRSFEGPRNPGQFDTKAYYGSQKLIYSIKSDSLTAKEGGGSLYRAFLYRFRRKCLTILDQITEPEDRGIFQAALLGEKGNLDEAIKNLYQENGIAHLLAISGLHVTLIGMGAYGLLRRAGLGYGSAGLVCGFLIISYGILSGETSSVTRAVIMLCCQCGANYLGRTYDLVSAACFAALLLLFNSPSALFQGGVQLSFGAVLSIGILGRYLNQVFEPDDRIPREGQSRETGAACSPLSLSSLKTAVLKTILTSLAIQLVTYPFLLFHFYEYPIYGILLNFVVVPLMAYVIYSGMAGILLGWFSLGAGVGAIGSGHYILEFYGWICRACSKLPYSNLILGRPGWGQLVGYVVCVLLGLWLIKGFKGFWRKMGALSLMTLCCFFLLFPLPVKGMEVIFLDVGQGDGIVIRTKDGNILVDGGSSSEKELGTYRLEPFLKRYGIGTIDYAVVSHADLDHINGLQYLLDEDTGIVVKQLLLPCLGKGDPSYTDLSESGVKHGSLIHYIAQGDRLQIGELRMDCLYPGWEDLAADKNDQSAMYRVSFGALSILLTGDMGVEGEEMMVKSQREKGTLKSIQVLKAGHHGSKTSTGEELLENLDLRWAVLSYGEDNSYGHPHKEVTERLEVAGIRIWRTAESGAITLKTDGRKLLWIPYIG